MGKDEYKDGMWASIIEIIRARVHHKIATSTVVELEAMPRLDSEIASQHSLSLLSLESWRARFSLT